MFYTRQRQIEALIGEYREQASACVQRAHDSLVRYCDSGDLARLARDVIDVHHAESRADDLRRDIETLMYAKALFPESRGDVLGLLETLDTVPNQAQAVVRAIVQQYIVVPQPLHAPMCELLSLCMRCVSVMMEAVGRLFTDFTNVADLLGKIDEMESRSDTLEGQLIQQVFASPGIKDLDKVLLRDLIHGISAICDMAENVADRIRIIVIKRVS
ncbi:MAG: DUF47 family protein [Candidatus Hydrogenedentes bacterium]|nr:DUF47 family protein [Candidatus Hydrogenedentota bacterium]